MGSAPLLFNFFLSSVLLILSILYISLVFFLIPCLHLAFFLFSARYLFCRSSRRIPGRALINTQSYQVNPRYTQRVRLEKLFRACYWLSSKSPPKIQLFIPCPLPHPFCVPLSVPVAVSAASWFILRFKRKLLSRSNCVRQHWPVFSHAAWVRPLSIVQPSK